jgi:predicted ribonuclease toxin of YeeF-YezG toxin-antitoxin module
MVYNKEVSMPRVRRRRPLVERFWSNVDRSGGDKACWIWTAGKSGDGYGGFRVGKIQTTAHRYAWILTNGPVPDGLFVCHDCPGGDNPACVNPAHMFLGTNGDNQRDASAKGMLSHGDDHNSRRNPESLKRGEENKQSKLTAEQVRSIRTEYASGTTTQDELARKYHVVRNAIWMIVKRKTWAHVDP